MGKLKPLCFNAFVLGVFLVIFAEYFAYLFYNIFILIKQKNNIY